MIPDFSDAELEAYLDESLDAGRAAELEQIIRSDRSLIQRLSAINGRRDAGVHTLGEIWRRNQIGVPTRDQLLGYLKGNLSAELREYIRFRLEVLKCRFTSALLADLQSQVRGTEPSDSSERRTKFYESGAGFLQKKKGRK